MPGTEAVETAVERFAVLLEEALAQPPSSTIPAGETVVVAGMGGSGIGGALAQALAARCGGPLVVAWSDYGLPAWADASTHVVCVSYSGNTAETLSAARTARDRGCRWEAITTGGHLAALAAEADVPVSAIPSGQQPRAALPLLLVPILRRLTIPDLAEQFDEALAVCRDALPIGTLAERLAGQLPCVYGAGGLATVAYRWRCQIQENAKQPALHHALPELNHNEIVGWTRPHPGTAVVALREPDEPPEIAARWEATRAVAWEPAGIAVEEVVARGETPLARWLSLVQLGDRLSVAMARINGVDPTPVELIEGLKQRLWGR